MNFNKINWDLAGEKLVKAKKVAFEKAPQNFYSLGVFRVCVNFRQFVFEQIIGFESPTPPLSTSTTVGIELSKLRKPLFT